MRTVTVASASDVDSTITSYLAQGFVVSNRTDTGATLQKHKKFNLGALLLLLIPFIGWAALIVYIAMFAMKPNAEVVNVAISADAKEAAQ